MIGKETSISCNKMITNPDFWKNKTVLLTGHTGFKGSWLALWLSGMGARVCGFALEPSTVPNLFTTAQVADSMKSIIGDLRDLESIESVFRTERPEIVIHMAAQALVRRSYSDPVETFSTNVMGTVNLLETIRRADFVRAALVVTSDKCYENKEFTRPYTEQDALGGADPYASSKGCAEIVTRSYRDSFFVRGDGNGAAVATVRAGNVIGGGDWAPNRIVTDVVAALCAHKSVIIRSPRATRPWQHVLDALNGYLILLERLWDDGASFAEAWNFGPNPSEVRTVLWLVETLEALWGGGNGWELDTQANLPEAHTLILDSEKSRLRLNWEPNLTLTMALEWVVEWYSAWMVTGNGRKVTEAQISRFKSLGRGTYAT
jgi:CDP-glucose 4,6-dehydratase